MSTCQTCRFGPGPARVICTFIDFYKHALFCLDDVRHSNGGGSFACDETKSNNELPPWKRP